MDYFCRCVIILLLNFMAYNKCPLQTMDRFKKALEYNDIMFTEKRFDTAKGVESLGDNPFVCSI